MSELELFPSDNELEAPQQATGSKAASSADPIAPPSRPGCSAEPETSARGRRRNRPDSHTPRSLRSPPPSRQPIQSPSTSHASASPSIPPIGKWTVAGLRQALSNSDVRFSRNMSKAQLYELYSTLGNNPPTSKKVTKAHRSKQRVTQMSSSSSSSSSSPQASGHSRSSAGRGHAPNSAAPPIALPPSSQPISAAPSAASPHATVPTGANFQPPLISTLPSAAKTSARLPPLAAQAQPPYFYPSTFSFPHQWPAAPVADTQAGNPQLATQAGGPPSSFPSSSFSPYGLPQAPGFNPCVRMPPQTGATPPSFPPFSFYPSPYGPTPAPGDNPCVRMPPQTVMAPPHLPSNSSTQAKPQYTLFTATPLHTPPNAAAMEPPPVPSSIKSQILTEIQNAGSGSRHITYPSSSLFTTHISITHPLKPLLDASIDSILHAVSPRTIQSYLTAWRCFKTFHLSYHLPFPDFSLLSITSFISFLSTAKNLQASSIKGYLSGVQFFHKLIHGFPSSVINNSQTSLLIKGIQRARPSNPDSRQPITLDILTNCIQKLRTGYHSIHTARTLDAMFLLAFFGFLRCSEIAITSKFNPKLHPTISDLCIRDNETIAYSIKHSKTDQERKGHYIYIFNLPSPIQPYQALVSYIQFRNAQSKSALDPLFVDDSNHPVTRFWFQKHLKLILTQSGFHAENFSSHSFRIGAATTAAQKGLSQNQIQALGRWSSEAFKSYIRYNQSHIKAAHAALIS
ncbi:proline-rich protein 36-like [Carassius auratus]|uniref:Proline-rich protein 36-like n=1 Tax=Carassius auratus TaxID=7957 RepID=A0A6P6QXR7_CARAU|nr:proline-rich protein 36-like [Carassius auratus]